MTRPHALPRRLCQRPAGLCSCPAPAGTLLGGTLGTMSLHGGAWLRLCGLQGGEQTLRPHWKGHSEPCAWKGDGGIVCPGVRAEVVAWS